MMTVCQSMSYKWLFIKVYMYLCFANTYLSLFYWISVFCHEKYIVIYMYMVFSICHAFGIINMAIAVETYETLIKLQVCFNTCYREVDEKAEPFSMWSGQFEKTNESMTLVKGYFQQWIPTPDNFRSLLVVSAHIQMIKFCLRICS